MILAIDIGNTNIVLGIFEGEELTARFMISTKERSMDEFGVLMSEMFRLKGVKYDSFEAVVVSCVVPNILSAMVGAVEKYFGIRPFVVGPGTKTGIRLVCENPKEIGAGRIVDAAAAYTIYGGPVLVVDYGTATTYDLISGDGSFIAGVTATGITLSAKALWEGTAMLPNIDIEKPKSILAKNTVSSMQAGLVYGQIGQSEYIIKSMIEESGFEKVFVAATGETGNLIASNTKYIDIYNPDLRLSGLRIIWSKNANRKCEAGK